MISTKEASPGRETNVAPDDCGISSVSHLVQWPEETTSFPAAPASRASSPNKEPELSVDRLCSVLKDALLGKEIDYWNFGEPLDKIENTMRDAFWACGSILPELSYRSYPILEISSAGAKLFGQPIARDLDGDGKIDWIETRPEVLNSLIEKLSNTARGATLHTLHGIAEGLVNMMHVLHESGIKKAFTCGGSGALLTMVLPHAWEALYPAEKCPLLHHVSQADNNRLYAKRAMHDERDVADPETVRKILAPLLRERSFLNLFRGRERIACIDDFELSGLKHQALKKALVDAKIHPSFWYITGPGGSNPDHLATQNDSLLEKDLIRMAKRFSADVAASPALHTASFTSSEQSTIESHLSDGAKTIRSELLKAIESAAAQRRRLSNAA